MARKQGICGFETGRTDAGYTIVGGALQSLSVRTGNYAYQDKKTVAATNGFCVINTGFTVADGGLVQLKLRAYFQPITFPNTGNLYLISLSGLGVRIEMNNSGQIRFNSTLTTAPAYSAQTVVGHWYMCRMRIQGYNKTGSVANSGRLRALVEVYDCGTDGLDIPELLLDYQTPDQPAVAVPNINCDDPSGEFAIPGDALQTISGKSRMVDFKLVLVNSAPGGCGVNANGEYSTFVSETVAHGPEGGVPCSGVCTATNGTVREAGELNGADVMSFIHSSSALTDVNISLGNTVDGVSSTREINYDDVYWDFQDEADVPVDFTFPDQFPFSTNVRPYAAVAQGFFDAFTPSGAFGDINDIPMTDTNTVTSSLAGDRTSYVHADLEPLSIAEHIRVYIRWGGSAATQDIILNTGASVLSNKTAVNEVGANGDQVDFPFEDGAYLSADEFNDIEYGLELNVSTLTNLHSLFAEVLTGPLIQLEPLDDFAVVPEIFPEAVSPSVEGEITLGVTAALTLKNGRGDAINVPVTWRLNRFDVGPRNEEKS